MLYFVKKLCLFIDYHFASIYDTKMSKEGHINRQEKLKFKICFVEKY